jgi:hypothetical protein
MKRFLASLAAASALSATIADATSLLDLTPYPAESAILQAFGIGNRGDVAGAFAQPGTLSGPNLAAGDGGLASFSGATGPASPVDLTRDGFADGAPASSSLVNQIIGIDILAGVFVADQPNSQTLIEMQEFDSASYMLDRFGTSVARALGSVKR